MTVVESKGESSRSTQKAHGSSRLENVKKFGYGESNPGLSRAGRTRMILLLRGDNVSHYTISDTLMGMLH